MSDREVNMDNNDTLTSLEGGDARREGLPATREMPRLKIPFRRPPFWTVTMVSLLVGVGVGLLGALPSTLTQAEEGRWHLVLLINGGVLVVLAGSVAAIRAVTRPRAIPPIEVYDDYLLLPKSAGSTRTRQVTYDNLLSLSVFGQGKWAKVFVDTRQRLIWYPLRAFLDDKAVELLRTEVRARLLQRPDGTTLLEQMDKREAIGRVAWAAKPVVTAVLIGTIGLCFALEYAVGGLKHPFGLVRYGANASVLVADGQLFRLVAANFLHANLLHTYLNAFALYVLGMLLERLIGPWRFLLIYLMGAIGGAVASTLVAQAAFSVGASTAVFGLLAALGVINWRFRAELPGRFRQPVRWWVFILGLNIILPVLVPQIDVAAHVGGFVIGGLATAIICRRPESMQPQLATTPSIKWASLGLTGLFAIGLIQAAVYAKQPAPGDETRVARVFVAASSAQPEALNAVAWAYATDPNASADQLDLAQVAVERALQSMPDSPPFLDSLATVYFRRGQLDQAIATERQAIDKQATQFYMSQIGRFLEARRRASGPLEIGAEALASRISLSVKPRYRVQNGKRAFFLEISTESPRGMVLYALAKRGHTIQGVLWVVLGPNTRRQYRLVPDGKPFINDWSDDIYFEVALVDTSGCDCKSGSWRWRYWSMDREVLMLP